MQEPGKDDWWKHGVIYHIYIRSFYDSNSDGIGDIPGIIKKFDYIRNLGVTALWLSPVFQSPMKDFGYDISDFMNIDPIYGTMEDLEHLISLAHKHEIRIILDIALNHTSNLHPWFIESRSSINNPRRDWYIWKTGRGNSPPTNWITGLFESAWTFDDLTQQYYLHSFLDHQPDLNWRNHEVSHTMIGIMEYWMKKGIDGFRLDMINWLVKDKRLRDNPAGLLPNIFQKQVYNKNRKSVKHLLKRIRKSTDNYPGRITIGEVFSMPPGNPKLSASYIGDGEKYLHMAFDFSLMYRCWNSRSLFKTVCTWLESLEANAWPCHVLSNHDQMRSFSRLCKGPHGILKAKLLFVFLFTLPGTPFLYYGEEIGMKNFRISRDKILDPLGKKFWPIYKGRDSSRAPMQWDSTPNAGFTDGFSPWLPVNPEYFRNNASSQNNNPESLLNVVRKLVQIRKQQPSLQGKEWEVIEKKQLISYMRKSAGERLLVVLNFSRFRKNFKVRSGEEWSIIFATSLNRSVSEKVSGNLQLDPYEAIVLNSEEQIFSQAP